MSRRGRQISGPTGQSHRLLGAQASPDYECRRQPPATTRRGREIPPTDRGRIWRRDQFAALDNEPRDGVLLTGHPGAHGRPPPIETKNAIAGTTATSVRHPTPSVTDRLDPC